MAFKPLMETTTEPSPAKLPMPFLGTGGRVLLFLWWVFYGYSKIGHPKTVAKLKKKIRTPWAMQAYLYNVIKYKSDKEPEDHWQEPQRTINRRAGDCEDWALLANAVLASRYKCVFLCMYTNSKGHATYLVKEGPLALTSIGTFGIMWHTTDNYRKIIPSWQGFQDWVSARVLDENVDPIERIVR